MKLDHIVNLWRIAFESKNALKVNLEGDHGEAFNELATEKVISSLDSMMDLLRDEHDKAHTREHETVSTKAVRLYKDMVFDTALPQNWVNNLSHGRWNGQEVPSFDLRGNFVSAYPNNNSGPRLAPLTLKGFYYAKYVLRPLGLDPLIPDLIIGGYQPEEVF